MMKDPPGNETEHEGGKIIDLPLPSQAEEAASASLSRFIEQFQGLSKTLSDAAMQFREQISVSPRACQNAIEALQAMRRQTNTCLEFLESNWRSSMGCGTSFFSVRSSLCELDGEKTARLILETSLFQSFVLKSYNEDLSQAKQRITMHVALQTSMKDEVTKLDELIVKLSQLLAAKPLPPVPCKNTGPN